MSKHAGKRVGFTLIELLVVISIIALLISLLLPVLASSRAVAEITQCLNKQRQLGIATVNYTQDNKNTMPMAIYDPDGNGATASIAWPNVNAYDGSSPTTNPYFGYVPLPTTYDGPFSCPTYYTDGIKPNQQATGVNALRVTYTYNFRIGSARSDVPYFAWFYPPVKIDSVQKASERAYLIDGTFRSAPPSSYRLDYAAASFTTPGTTTQNSPMNRHYRDTNDLLFFDGHAVNRSGTDIYNGGVAGQTFWTAIPN